MSGQGVGVLAELLSLWGARSRDALPADAMLINRHIRELRDACRTVDAIAESLARFAVEKAEFRRLAVALAECVEIVHDAEKDWRSEGHIGMPDSVFARLKDALERSRELGVLANVSGGAK